MNHRYSYDMPDNYYFGGGGDTFITPLALAILICSVLLICVLPRKYVIVPLLMAGLFLPTPVTLLFAGFHFNASRLLLMAGWVRTLFRGEVNLKRMNSLDKALLAWALSGAFMFCVLWGSAAASNRLGFLYTNLGTYFLMRVLIRDKADILRVTTTFAITLILLTPSLIQERVTGYNPLSLLGAPAESTVRYGGVRAQGPFLHPIICGVLGSMLMPAFLSLWWQGRSNRRIAVIGVSASTIMMITSASSTPLMTFGAGLLGFLLWPVRRNLGQLRRGFVVVLVILHLLMTAPVWFLIAHVGAQTGGSGYHRAMLIDNFIRHFSQWWLFGTRNNADWGFDMWDVDNAFVNNGLQGGLLTFVLFIAIFVYGFKLVGKARIQTEKSIKDGRLIWGIGCALFANSFAFFGIFYFDQSILAWYCLLAMVSAAGTLIRPQSLNQMSRAAFASGSSVISPLESETRTSASFLRP
jgi:hypothetical protein